MFANMRIRTCTCSPRQGTINKQTIALRAKSLSKILLMIINSKSKCQFNATCPLRK